MSHHLITERLVLRRFTADDSGWVADALADLDVARWVPLLPHPYGLSDACAFVEKQSGHATDALAVTHDGTPIGCITIATELGYWFAKSAWGKGFGTEAARAIVGRHFEAETDNLQSGYMLDNTRSCRVLEKLGFAPTLTVKRQSTSLDREVTIQRMELSRADWQGRVA